MIAAVAALCPPPAAGQAGPAERRLTKPEAEFGQSFDQVFALRELSSGKVLVTDLGPRSVLLADFRTGEQTTIGRNGQGPGEYQFPGELLAVPGDTTLLADRASRRFLTILPDGRLGKTLPYPDQIPGLPEVRGADRNGRVYFQGSPGGGLMDDGGPTRLPDSVPVFRWSRGTGAVDTVTRVKIPAIKMDVSGGANARAVIMRPQPYAAQDDWAVAPDGRLAVVRVGDFHVEWVGGARVVAGPPMRYEAVPVTSADKERFLALLRASKNRIMVTSGGPGRSVELPGPPPPAAGDFDWPAVKPPFPGRGAIVSPEGELWLQRATTARDSTPVYDVFDPAGMPTARVFLPIGRRLVGLGAGTLYTVRTDEDGLQWLERYRR
jgi:hypothetical protein